MEKENKVFIGIDFGLTKSRACFIDPETKQPQLIVDMIGSSQIPCELSFVKDKKGNLTQFGNLVKCNPSLNCVFSQLLRFIGQPFSEMEEMAERLGIDIEEGENGECIFCYSRSRMWR